MKEKPKDEKTRRAIKKIVEKAGLNEKDERIKYLLNKEKPKYQSLGCGIINGVFYFGTKVYDGNKGMDAIITSDKKIYVAYSEDNEIKSFGLNYRFPFFDEVLDYTWSNNSSLYSIKSFLYEKDQEVSLKDCFKDCYENNKKFMHYEEDIVNVSISCSMLSSYFLPIFETKGRDFFNAEKESGKTRQSFLYDLQMFNPLMSADITGSSYFRAIESTNASIIVDDFDSIDEEKKLLQIQIIRAGYKKGQKSVRTGDDKKRTPGSFNIFNSMVINNVGGLDEITQDRCNTYYLVKTTKKEKTDKKLNEKDIKWTIERDKKFYCSLKEWKKVKEVYETLVVNELSGRDLEKVIPILVIGKIVLNEETYKKLLEYEIERLKEVRIKDVSEDWIFLGLKYIVKRILMEKKEVELRLDNIVFEVLRGLSIEPFTIQGYENKEYPKKKFAISSTLGKVFKNTPLFKSSKVHGGFVKYTFKPEKVFKFLEIRNYLDFFEEKDIEKLVEMTLNDTTPNNT